MLRMTRRLQAASLQDSLTGLPNRRVIEARLKHEWRRWARHAAPFTVLAVDLDHFKQVNDTHGHLAGDEMLVQVGQRLLAGVREVDTVARTGGEEFLLLLPDTDAAAALAAAERVRACVGDEPLRVRGQSLRMTTCVGVAQVVDGDADVAAVLARADAALYRAKAAGRNRVCGVDAAQAEGAPASTA
jgi:diguanylate cyclase (GGDEF)-like protein